MIRTFVQKKKLIDTPCKNNINTVIKEHVLSKYVCLLLTIAGCR